MYFICEKEINLGEPGMEYNGCVIPKFNMLKNKPPMRRYLEIGLCEIIRVK